MPDLSVIETALGQALAAVSGIGEIAWPNRSADPVRPFVLFDHVPTQWENATVDGSEVRADGYVIASICIAQGGFTTDANARAGDIIAAFPPGLRLGGACIIQASPVRGYPDGIGWRQPVRIDYRSEA